MGRTLQTNVLQAGGTVLPAGEALGMASQEADREDLLRQATALVERAELRCGQRGEPVVIGFRRDGSASFFFGSDPVLQFTAAGQLRRVYQRGLLYKAVNGTLHEMVRERTLEKVVLKSRELSDRELFELLNCVQARLRNFAEALRSGDFELLGQVPPEGTIVARTLSWLEAIPAELSAAQRPHAG